MIVLISSSMAFGQSESRVEKKCERYENGELIEDKYYLEKNGQVIAGEDFSTPELDQMQAKFASRQAEMELRMQEMQERSDAMMRKAQQNMNLRMEEMQQRMNEMQQQQRLPSQIPLQKNPSLNSLDTTYKT